MLEVLKIQASLGNTYYVLTVTMNDRIAQAFALAADTPETLEPETPEPKKPVRKKPAPKTKKEEKTVVAKKV